MATVDEAQLVRREQRVEAAADASFRMSISRVRSARTSGKMDPTCALPSRSVSSTRMPTTPRSDGIVTIGRAQQTTAICDFCTQVGLAGVDDERQEEALVVEQVQRLLVPVAKAVVRLHEDVSVEPAAVRERDCDTASDLLDAVLAHPPSVGTGAVIFKLTLRCCARVARASASGYVPGVLGRVLAILVLLAANGFFVAAEFSIVRSRRSRLEAMARGGDARARIVLRATANLAKLLSAVQFGVTLASIGIGALAEEALSHAVDADVRAVAACSRAWGSAPDSARCARWRS